MPAHPRSTRKRAVPLLRAYRRKISKSLQLRGLSGTARVALRVALSRLRDLGPSRRRRRAFDSEFDRSLGIDTAGIVNLSELEIQDPAWIYGERYEASPVDQFRSLMQHVPVRPGKFTFIDLGAGKGRVLLLATAYPFAAILGVELSAELCDIARQNISRYPPARWFPGRMEVSCTNAASFRFPPVPSVVFAYNPFGPEVMQSVARGLQESLAADPRELYFVYLTPDHARIIDGVRGLERQATGPDWVIWRSPSQPPRAARSRRDDDSS
jgi:SAM-dependent methyltransferase